MHKLEGKTYLITADYTGRIYCSSKSCVDAHRENKKRESEEHRKELRKQWYQDHREECLAKQKERRKYNREKDRMWKSAHREQINQHVQEHKQVDPVFKLKCQARNTIYQSFARTGNVKQERCEAITGLPIDDLVQYLCNTYERNYGRKWDGVEPVHIDHITPLAAAKTENDVKTLCHYTNLQLLTARDNLAKGAKC